MAKYDFDIEIEDLDYDRVYNALKDLENERIYIKADNGKEIDVIMPMQESEKDIDFIGRCMTKIMDGLILQKEYEIEQKKYQEALLKISPPVKPEVNDIIKIKEKEN